MSSAFGKKEIGIAFCTSSSFKVKLKKQRNGYFQLTEIAEKRQNGYFQLLGNSEKNVKRAISSQLEIARKR